MADHDGLACLKYTRLKNGDYRFAVVEAFGTSHRELYQEVSMSQEDQEMMSRALKNPVSAIARLDDLERERIKLRNRLTAWMLNLSSEGSGMDLLDRIDAIESEQDSLRAVLNDKLGDPLAA